MKVSVVGSGAWGTALAIRLCKNGHDVTMWTFEKDLIPEMESTRRNPRGSEDLRRLCLHPRQPSGGHGLSLLPHALRLPGRGSLHR